MNKCAAAHCPNTATKDSAFCLPHAIEAGGALYLASTLRGNLLPDAHYPAPVTPPRVIHNGVMIAIKEKADAP